MGQIRLLLGQHAIGLVPRDGRDKLRTAIREVVEELALAGPRELAHIIERDVHDAAFADSAGCTVDDPLPGRDALGRQRALHHSTPN